MSDQWPTFTFGELLKLGAIATFCIFSFWNIALNVEARKSGVTLVGHYTGTYESRTSRSKLSSNRNLHLVVEAAVPGAAVQRLPLRESTPAEDVPDAGTAMEVVWVSTRPDEFRRAADVNDVFPLASVFWFGLAGVFAAAFAWDRRTRRRG